MKKVIKQSMLSIIMLMCVLNANAQLNELKKLVFEVNKACPIESAAGSQFRSCKYQDGSIILDYNLGSMLNLALMKERALQSKNVVLEMFFENDVTRDLMDLVIKCDVGVIFNYEDAKGGNFSLTYTPEEVKNIGERGGIKKEGIEYVKYFAEVQNISSFAVNNTYGVEELKFECDNNYLYYIMVFNNKYFMGNYVIDDDTLKKMVLGIVSLDSNLGKQLVSANMGFCVKMIAKDSGKKKSNSLSANDIKKLLTY